MPPSNFKEISVDSFIYLGPTEEDDAAYWAVDVTDTPTFRLGSGSDGFCFVELRTLMVATDWADTDAMGELSIAGHFEDHIMCSFQERGCGMWGRVCRSPSFQVPLPENPPWWLVFDADQARIEEVCRVLAHLYILPKAQYVSVYKDVDSFTSANQTHISKESPVNGTANDSGTPKSTNSQDSKDMKIKAALDKLKESKKSDEDLNTRPADVDTKDDGTEKPRGDHKLDANEKNHERERERSKIRERSRDVWGRGSDHDNSRGRDSDRDRDWEKERSHRSKDKISEKPRHHSPEIEVNITVHTRPVTRSVTGTTHTPDV